MYAPLAWKRQEAESLVFWWVFCCIYLYISERTQAAETKCVCFLCAACSKASRAVGWFFLSGRLRQDRQFSYAIYLENIRWHMCAGLHLSVTYCRFHIFDLSSSWGTTQVLSLFSFVTLVPSDHWQLDVAHGVLDQTDLQAGSTMSPLQKWNSFSSRVNLFKESFYCDLKANIKLPAGKRDASMPCALFHQNVSA